MKFRHAHDRKLNYSNSLELLYNRTPLEFNENRNSASKNHAYIMKNAKNCLKKLIFSVCKYNEFLQFSYAFYAIFYALFDETIKFYIWGILQKL